ncbi:tyrosine-type recombinase/integrase [Phenylobacterium sp.]|uniref:tyrosine-type recombinase/integrase n=1 Tax=Phenylobacterium sp. TaxID=1871053 RepID=UPI0035AFB625
MAKEQGRVARLTKRTVDAVTKQAERLIIWDADLKGFGLRVEPSGSKTFIVRYRVGGGRRGTRRQFKIGSYGKLTPDQARAKAEEILAQVELGQDPQAERAKAREALTVAELCDLYLKEGVATKKASTIALDRIRINGHIKPLIGARKITELGKGEVERMMADIAAGRVKPKAAPVADLGDCSDKTKEPGSRARGGQTAATKSVKLLGAVFKFAIGRKLCAENPCVGVKVFADTRRERFLSPAELGRLGDALTAAEADGALPAHVAIIRLLALTGARKNEIARLRWSEVDAERGLLRLEDSKTGPRPVRLGAAALEVLSQVVRTKSPHVFPDPRDPSLPVRNLDWAWVGVRKRAGLDDVRIHDLRHSFASIGLAGGQALPLIGKLLGHSHVATTARYAHLADDPLQTAADRISSQVAAALAGTAAEVDPIRKVGQP